MGETLKALARPSMIRFRKRLLPVRYLPTMVSTAIGLVMPERKVRAYGEMTNLSLYKEMKGMAVVVVLSYVVIMVIVFDV